MRRVRAPRGVCTMIRMRPSASMPRVTNLRSPSASGSSIVTANGSRSACSACAKLTRCLARFDFALDGSNSISTRPLCIFYAYCQASRRKTRLASATAGRQHSAGLADVVVESLMAVRKYGSKLRGRFRCGWCGQPGDGLPLGTDAVMESTHARPYLNTRIRMPHRSCRREAQAERKRRMGATFNLHADQPRCEPLRYAIGRGLGIDGPNRCRSRPAEGQPERVATRTPRSDPLCCSPSRFAFDLVARHGANGIKGRMYSAIAQRGTKSVGLPLFMAALRLRCCCRAWSKRDGRQHTSRDCGTRNRDCGTRTKSVGPK